MGSTRDPLQHRAADPCVRAFGMLRHHTLVLVPVDDEGGALDVSQREFAKTRGPADVEFCLSEWPSLGGRTEPHAEQRWAVPALRPTWASARGRERTARPPSRRAASRSVGGFRAFTLSGAGWPDRRDGYRNDIRRLAEFGELPLADIVCPTLIIHGEEDQGVVPEHAERAHARISGSVLQWIPGGGHLAFFVSPVAQADALAWLTASTR